MPETESTAPQAFPNRGGSSTTRLLTRLLLAVCMLHGSTWGSLAEDADVVQVQLIRVIDESGCGVESEIRTVDSEDKEKHFTYTEPNGTKELNKACPRSYRLKAKPKVSVYRTKKKMRYCNEQVEIVLELAPVYGFLYVDGVLASNRADHGVAAMLFTEVAARADEADPELAREAERQAYLSAARALGVEHAVRFDNPQRRYVLTETGVSALRNYQQQQNLSMSGALDADTLKVLAGSAFGVFIADGYARARLARLHKDDTECHY